jgi:hypothetical protein
MQKLIKVLILQATWFLCVLKGPDYPIAIVGFSLFLLVLDYFLLAKHLKPKKYLLFATSLIMFGLIHDPILHHFYIIQIKQTPYWMVSMWIIFIPYYHDVFSWVYSKKLYLPFLMGLIGGPMAYRGGAALGSIEITQFPLSFIIIGLTWSLFFPLSIKLFSRLFPSENT